MAYRVLVVDDDKQIVRLVRSYLEQAGIIVFCAYDGNEAMQYVRTEHPDLIVLDLMLPYRDGWEITKQLRHDERFAQIPILMLTARVDDVDKIKGFDLGADDYLTKPFNPLEVVARVRAILRRASGSPAMTRILEIGALRMDLECRTVRIEGRKIEITPTEFALLHTLMENPNRVFTRAELIERALGYSYEGMERTLDSHIKNLRKKVEPNPSQPRLIETIFGVGYCLREEQRIA